MLKDVKPYTAPARLLLSTVKRMSIPSHVFYLDNKKSKIVCLLTWPKHQLKECTFFSCYLKRNVHYNIIALYCSVFFFFLWTLIPKISYSHNKSHPVISIWCILHSSGNQLNSNEEGKNVHTRYIYISKSVGRHFNYNFTNKAF